MRFLPLLLVLPCLAASPPVPGVPAEHARDMAASRELFTRSVRKTLVDNCLKCHGDKKTRGGLDLATRELLLKGGDNGPAAVPGKGQVSKLYRLAAKLDEPHMPPKGNAPLTKAQLADLTKWIDLGAAYDKPLLERTAKPKTLVVTAEDRNFWSFRPLARPTLPAVKDAGWGRNPLDRFLLAAMEGKGLTPTAEADRRTLVRRVTFALTGLPPTPAQIDAFLADKRSDAYERLVDRLLADPAHGERWARHWLDIVRFGESHGFEHDYDRPHAWPYRDFVIRALNRDVPYDTFIRWQIAGDEIAPRDPLALTATGFLGAGVHSTQITANTVEKERYDELDDIVRTMGTAFLGLTVGCARCHDHKYDPIPMKDYYRLVSTFTKTVRSDQDIEMEPELAKAAKERHAAELAALEKELARVEANVVTPRLKEWLKKGGSAPSAWTVITPKMSKSTKGATLTAQPDGSLLATGTNPPFDAYHFTLAGLSGKITAVRLEALAHPSMVRGGPGRAGNGNFALSDVKLIAIRPGKAPVPVKIAAARATFEQRGLPVAATIDSDMRSAWAVDPQFGKDHAAVFDLAEPLDLGVGGELNVVLRFNNNTGHNIGRPRLSVSTQSKPPVEAGGGVPADVQRALSLKGEMSEKDFAVVLRWYRGRDADWQAVSARREALVKRGAAVAKVKAMICGEGLPPIRLHSQGGDFLEHTHFLNRGDPNQKGEVASQSFPTLLMRGADEKRWQETPPPGAKTPYLRRSLANWLVDVDHGAGHLLARVMVNRLWYHHFGRGIVATTSDFGLQGERPSHPELLDWLAGELIRSGWSLKHIHRLIVTSAAYRQGTAFDAKKNAIDSENKYLWRRVPRRLEAEAIRDSLLAVSGRLDRRMGGPGTLAQDMPRRAVYFFIKRSQLSPMMTLFDAPDGTVGIEGRTTTTIAPQALLLMNSPVVRKAADDFARRLSGKADADAVTEGFALALGRSPTAEELRELVAFLTEQRQAYEEEKKADAVERARRDLCQALLGLNEFVYVD